MGKKRNAVSDQTKGTLLRDIQSLQYNFVFYLTMGQIASSLRSFQFKCRCYGTDARQLFYSKGFQIANILGCVDLLQYLLHILFVWLLFQTFNNVKCFWFKGHIKTGYRLDLACGHQSIDPLYRITCQEAPTRLRFWRGGMECILFTLVFLLSSTVTFTQQPFKKYLITEQMTE